MRPATALRIAVGVGVVWSATVLLLLATGDPDAPGLLKQLLAVSITVVGIAWAGYRYRILPRRGSFESQARDAGLQAQAGDPLGLLQMPFAMFRRSASARDLENTAWGLRNDRETVVADYWLAPSSDTTRDDYERFVCVIDLARPEWPNVSVVPTGLASILKGAVGLDDVDLESDRFDRVFDVRTTDRRFASALLDARMMEWLLLQPPGVGFEVVGGKLMVFGPRPRTSIDDLPRALRRFDGFLDQVPPVVSSLYPIAARVPATTPPVRPDL